MLQELRYIADTISPKEIELPELELKDLLVMKGEDPAKICENALRVGKVVRVFEWINMGVSPGHPHNLTEDKLNGWLKGYGKIEKMTGQNGCKGQCYYGIFKGDKFES